MKVSQIAIAIVALLIFTSCKKTNTVQNKLQITQESASKEVIQATANEQQAQKPLTGTLSPADFKKKIEAKKVQLIDVRTLHEFNANRLKGALNFDFYKRSFVSDMSNSALDKTKPIYIYCRTGNRTGHALKKLSDAGFKEVYDLGSGIVGWARQGYKVEQ